VIQPLPKEWVSTKLGQVAKEMIGGGTPSTKNPDFWKGDVPWLTSKSLGDYIFLTAGEKTISEEAVRKSATHIVPAGNLIFATRVGVGKVVVTKIDVAISQDSTGIVVDPSEVDPLFLAYQLRSDSVQRFVEQNKRGATIQGITRTSLQQIDVVIPPLNEQSRIAHILITLQNAVEQQARLIDLTREFKSALMRKFFTEGLDGEKQKSTEIGLVPENWGVVELDELLLLTKYGLSIRGESEGKYPILRMTNQINGRIEATNLQFVNIEEAEFLKFHVQRGDILFNRTNSFELVGRTAIFDIEGDFVFASYLILARTDANKLNSFYLNHYFNWENTQVRLKSIATRAVSQSNISATRLRTFAIPLPPIEEQAEIVSQIDTVSERIELYTQKKNLLEELFRTLLHQLMTGQIRVNEITDLTGL